MSAPAPATPLIVVITERTIERARDRFAAELACIRDDEGHPLSPYRMSVEHGCEGVTIEARFA